MHRRVIPTYPADRQIQWKIVGARSSHPLAPVATAAVNTKKSSPSEADWRNRVFAR